MTHRERGGDSEEGRGRERGGESDRERVQKERQNKFADKIAKNK